MATYVVGDVQGCALTLRALLGGAGFRPARDELWLAGDLVNRGPRSLEVLRFVRALGDRATVVLGNHDVHLVARAAGVAPPKRRDTLDAVLAAPDRDELLSWLAGRPLLHERGAHVLVHAGLLPRWSLADARRAARAAEAALRGPRRAHVLGAAARARHRWNGSAAATIAVLTRLRVCSPRGALRLDFDGPPADAPAGTAPWFTHPHRRGRAVVLCGHWSTLGLHQGAGVVALDTGCVWGGSLTAFRLEDGRVFQQPLLD
jgi:bis(5'-nucleosyl)-tetraphosphatase (symmetrical)